MARYQNAIFAISIVFFYSNIALANEPPSVSTRTVSGYISISSASVSTPYDLIRGTVSSPVIAGTKVPWFPENLEYEVKWGIFSMGTAYVKIEEIVNFTGRAAYHIVSEAKTNGFADRFYKVRDLNESWMSVDDLRSFGYSKNLREGKFYRDEWVVYDYGHNSFLAKQVNKDKSFHYSTGTISGSVQDILSSIYFIRPKKLEIGDEIILDVNTKSNWPLVAKVIRKKTVKVPAGRFRTIVVEPFLRKEGIFIQKGKSMKIYLTNDKRHIPVLVQVEIVFGKISIYLTSINK